MTSDYRDLLAGAMVTRRALVCRLVDRRTESLTSLPADLLTPGSHPAQIPAR
ncbi:hypothetical protein [Frankia sp. R82]|uniref:hypothetical protein n=1 Tax=Frankia sp. R82 TaxID=2950553 RepID=UPI00204454E1|nr:hypothetical protein [Frankia sp. R82]MCM3883371.1 hypothetical protein [Frankia sp. R82]